MLVPVPGLASPSGRFASKKGSGWETRDSLLMLA